MLEICIRGYIISNRGYCKIRIILYFCVMNKMRKSKYRKYG